MNQHIEDKNNLFFNYNNIELNITLNIFKSLDKYINVFIKYGKITKIIRKWNILTPFKFKYYIEMEVNYDNNKKG